MRMQVVRGCVAGAVLISLTTSCKTPQSQSQALADDGVADGANAEAGASEGSDKGPPSYKWPDGHVSDWNEFCVGSLTDASVLPSPKYDNGKVAQAAKNLTKVNPHSFALYSTINAKYKGNSQAGIPQGTTPAAHEFLSYLCGEFRDRPSMVEAKIDWILRFNYMKKGQQPPIDTKKPLWMQVAASSYRPYLQISSQYFQQRQQRSAQKKHSFGQFTNVDYEIPATTVCENKFMIAEYVAKGKNYDGIDPFEQAYNAWKTDNCSEEDLDWYNDFRGDGNFKPNTPESNGMIWQAQSVTLQCASTTKVRAAPPFNQPNQVIKLTDQDCANYFLRPFTTRWAGARAGLGAWILHDDSEFSSMDDSRAQVDMIPDFKASIFTQPHNYVVEGNPGKLRPDWQSRWAAADLGLSDNWNEERVYRQLKNSVDRHTDWYASGYDDGMNQGKKISEAYSPFVASSYEISASDAFTAPCYTIPCNGEVPARNWKHWMFVFKVKRDRWYTTTSVKEGKKLDFDHHWFDETSFGTTGLAKGEHAFDRLGTALEDELDTVIYMHNICKNGQIEGEGTGGKACDGGALGPDPSDEGTPAAAN